MEYILKILKKHNLDEHFKDDIYLLEYFFYETKNLKSCIYYEHEIIFINFLFNYLLTYENNFFNTDNAETFLSKNIGIIFNTDDNEFFEICRQFNFFKNTKSKDAYSEKLWKIYDLKYLK